MGARIMGLRLSAAIAVGALVALGSGLAPATAASSSGRVGAAPVEPQVRSAATITAKAATSLPGWTGSLIGSSTALNGISCPSTNVCYAAGGLYNDVSVVEKTTNGGSSWSSLEFPGTASVGSLDAISCPDTTHCLATGGGTVGTAFATTDGTHWSQLTVPAGTKELSEVICRTDLECWAASYHGEGLSTLTGGHTWTPMPYSLTSGGTAIDDYGIAFSSDTDGWLVGEDASSCNSATQCPGYIQKTVDDGANWSFASLPANTASLAAIVCPSSTECLAAGGSFSQATGVRTTDGGSSWTAMPMPAEVGFVIAMSCANASDCWAVGLSNSRYSSTGVLESSDASVARTTNGGASWTYQPVQGGLFDVNAVACPSTTICRGVGPTYAGASVISTTDAGVPAQPGYWLVASDGGIFTFGSARFYGSTGNIKLNKPVVAMAADPLTGGYWMVASDGGIFSFNAPFHGSTGNVNLAKPIVGMAVDPVTGGYWLVASDGGVFSFDAPFYGSTGAQTLSAPIVGMTALDDGDGYLLIGADGTVYPFGAAKYTECTGNPDFKHPTSGIAMDPDTGGYWVTSQGGEIATCGAPFDGDTSTVALAKPVVGVTADPSTGGYWLDATDGGIFTFDSPFLGSTGGIVLNKPVVGIATVPGG